MNKTIDSQQQPKPRHQPHGGLLQRKCACGNHTMSGACTECSKKNLGLQPKLTVGASNDPLEREADRIADQVMPMPLHQTINPSPPRIQRSSPASNISGEPAPASVERVISSPGRSLEPVLREDMERRFGYDFSQVRVHTGAAAEQSARDVSAHAYTVGNKLVFGAGQYSPEHSSGKRLLAHELAHVLQKSNGGKVVRRQTGPLDSLGEVAERAAEDFAVSLLGDLTNAPPGEASSFIGDSSCHPNFCRPFTDSTVARQNLLWAGPLILAGIARRVNSRVVPLWVTYLSGGAAPQNLSSIFGTDFTASPTTATTTRFLVAELGADVVANHNSLLAGSSAASLDFTPRLTEALARLDDPSEPTPPQMNFNIPSDIAGNIAGGIGNDQTSFPIGARPSPFNDSRKAKIRADLVRNVDGTITITPSIRFVVKDTIDLCPGNCGTTNEQVATVPLSRFEATGLVGDVPFLINFSAPVAELTPFVVTPAPSPIVPATGIVIASSLRIRATPDISAARVGSYARGTSVIVLCRTVGQSIDGNDSWLQTDDGFVSARYVTLSGLVGSC